MEGILFRKKKKIDYDNEDDQDWTQYLHQNLDNDFHSLGSPFPSSSWSYQRKDSPFDTPDRLKKSDDDLHEDVVKKLYESKDVDASLIEVIVLNGHVLLTGKVQSEKAKAKVTELICNLDGVWKLENQLIVSQLS